MEYKEINIPLPDSYKNAIIKSIIDGIKIDILDFTKEYDLETYNGIRFLAWDFINTNLIRRINKDRFKCYKLKRGPWKLVLIYDCETKCIYSIMNDRRFREIQQKNSKDQLHYLYALASINKELKSINDYEQMCLFQIKNEFREKEIESILKEINEKLNDEIKQYVIVTFSLERYEVTSVSAYVPDKNLNILYEENWSEFILPDFDLLSFDTYDESLEEDDEIELKLRDEIIAEKIDNKDIKIKEIAKEKRGRKK